MYDGGGLAACYDDLTADVPYDRWVGFYNRIFERCEKEPSLILDLCCGTGSVSVRLARMGKQVIGVDASAAMLSAAQGKSADLEEPPVYICQRANKLDLYGTVDAAVSCLDGFNYILKPEELLETLERVRLFLNPGGTLIFDMQTPKALMALDGRTVVKETERFYLVWESSFSEKTGIAVYDIDIFQKHGEMWSRARERHRERAYSMEAVTDMLIKAGFCDICVYPPFQFKRLTGKEERWVFCAKKPER